MKAHTLVALSIFVSASSLAAQKPRDITPYLIADRTAEVALARTAAPSSVSGKATIMVLTPKGYVEGVHGTNGFTCLVMRSFSAAPDDPAFWNPRTSAPHCFNPPAARTILPAELTKIGWALSGATPVELTARIRKAYADKQFVMPEVGAMTYMLSPKQHLNDGKRPYWKPHLMFYYDRSVSASVLGAGGDTAPIVEADPKAPVGLFFIPTREWSDGTPGTSAPRK